MKVRDGEKLSIEELRTVSQLSKLSAEWKELWESTTHSPFQSPMWLLPWARHFTRENLLVLAIRSEAGLAAVAPFYLCKQDSTTKLFLLGNGHSDYLDVCCLLKYRCGVLAQLDSWLRSNSLFSQCEFNQLPPESPLLDLTDLAILDEPGVPCPVLQLTGKANSNYAPAHQIQKLLYYRRRAEKIGKLRFQTATRTDCRNFVLELSRLHHLRWALRGESGVLQEELVQSFHLEAANLFAETGHLRLHAVHLENQIIGVLYALSNHQSTYFYLSGYDPQFERLSPGTLLIGHAIETALAETHTQFDFLRGQEPYKYSWGAIDTRTFRRVITL